MFRRDVRNPASTNFQNSTNTRGFLAQTRKITKRILSPPRLPFRHTGVFCCMNNIDIIADSSPKIKMQLATRQISANSLSPFGLRACIPEETHHDRRSFFMGRSTSRTGRAAGRGLLRRVNSRQISGFSHRCSSGWPAGPRTNPASFFFLSASSSFCRSLAPVWPGKADDFSKKHFTNVKEITII